MSIETVVIVLMLVANVELAIIIARLGQKK